jgi:glycosyltransferase involved in cell wall biosynthesis
LKRLRTHRSAPRQTACIVVHNYLEMDPRARREAEALAGDGWSVDVVCLRAPGERRTETWNGIRVFRLPVRRHRGRGLAIYMAEYAAFFALALVMVSWLTLRRNYRLVQAHNVPDALVFTALLPRLFGARVILDIRDPLPDLYVSKFGGNHRHPAVRLARAVESASVAYADHVLTPGEPSRRRLIGRGIRADKVTNVLNSADPVLFQTLPRASTAAGSNGAFTLIYHGGLFERYGLDVAIRAVDRLRLDMPGIRLRVAGYGEELVNLQRLIDDLDLGAFVSLEGWIAPEAIPSFAAGADLGVVPYRRDSFTDLIYPTKAFEYIAMGIPVVVSDLVGIRELFAQVPDLFVRPGDVDDLAARILDLYRDPARLQRLNQATQLAYAPYGWTDQKRRYLALVDSIVDGATSTGSKRSAHPHLSPRA